SSRATRSGRWRRSSTASCRISSPISSRSPFSSPSRRSSSGCPHGCRRLPLTDDLVLSEVRNRVGVLTVNRPRIRNAIDVDMLLAIEAALGRLEVDPEVRVIVVTGAGDRAFMAGGDIGNLDSRRALAHYREFSEVVHRVFRRFET